jgi:hypothetical protein
MPLRSLALLGSPALVLLFTVLAPSARAASGLPEVLAERGFGDRANSYAWAMEWFQGDLYVGTGRKVMCVEAATSQFYFKFTSFYQTRPAPHVRCPADPFDMDLRAEIWRYTPATGRWTMVYRAPADIPNPRARGKLLARDIAYRGMQVMRDRRGRPALFISGVSANEYVPELARRHPPRLLRTYDGEHFHNISVPLVVRRTGAFADRRPIGFRGLEVWDDRLYVVASTALTGDGAVFEVRNPFGRKGRFSQVTPTDMHVFELQRFDGDLYVGTGSFADGYGVHRLRRPGPPYRFDPVVSGGAGMGTRMVSVVSMHPFRGRLYVGAVSWYSASLRELPASELIRVDRRGRWQVVTGHPRPGPDGRTRYPISGLIAGFANVFNSHLWRMVHRDGTLYVGTLDWSWLLQENESWAGRWSWLINALLSGEVGFDLWASCDGVGWLPVTRTAFNEDTYDFGVRSLAAGRRGFFLGSANHAFGTRIWHQRRSFCVPAGGTRTAAAPRRLLTDVQRDGTVLSWEPAAGAVRYRIERAPYAHAPVRFSPPGAPAIERRVPVQQSFATVGTTTGSAFVDATARAGTRYAYRVVAEAAGASAASNVQIVPDPRPPATWAQLEAAGVPRRTVAAVARGHRSARRHALARLARAAADDDVRQLALRLERRLRYATLAGGPVKGG